MSDTMLEILCARLEPIRESATRLLRDYSSLRRTDSTYFVDLSGDHNWNELPPEGKQIQASLLPRIDELAELLEVLSRNLPSSPKSELTKAFHFVRETVEQERSTYWKAPQEAIDYIEECVASIMTIMRDYFGSSTLEAVVIPDTNAFISSPNVESWRFDDVQHFTIVLMPTILAELDSHKTNHKNEAVREKSKKVVRKLKEYCRRGPIANGVNIVSGKISIKGIAREPDMSQTLPGLDPTVNDDRFLASTIEIIRDHLSATCFIVTGDIGMQIKAIAAGIPFREVPAADGDY